MNNLPIDIIRHIISYTYIIDLRRQFNIYQKINLDKYNNIDVIGRKLKEYFIVTTFEPNKIKYNYQYEIKNIEDIKNRSQQNIDNDMLFIEIIENSKQVEYNLEILKLKKKPFPEYNNPYDIFYKGNLGDMYYWQTIKLNYTV